MIKNAILAKFIIDNVRITKKKKSEFSKNSLKTAN